MKRRSDPPPRSQLSRSQLSRSQWLSGALASDESSAAGNGASSVARFSGALADLSVADLIQVLQLVGKSAIITVTRDGVDSRVWCADGSIIDAENGGLRGEPALFQILRFNRGSVVAELTAAARPRTIFASSQHLLLEAARREDEGQSVEEAFDANDLELFAPQADAFARGRDDAFARGRDDAFARARAGAEKPASLPPLVAQVPASEQRPAPRAGRGSLWLTLGVLLLVPGGYLWGVHTAREIEHAAAAEALRTSVEHSKQESAAQPPENYAIELRVEPFEAQISLDGAPVVNGYLKTSALRDGTSHELRVTAPGFVPASIFFKDVAPPASLRLVALPASVLDSSPVRTPPAAAAATGRGARRTRKSRGVEPRVQVIGEEPAVRIVE